MCTAWPARIGAPGRGAGALAMRTAGMFSCNGWPRVRIEQFGHDAPRAAPQAPPRPSRLRACPLIRRFPGRASVGTTSRGQRAPAGTGLSETCGVRVVARVLARGYRSYPTGDLALVGAEDVVRVGAAGVDPQVGQCQQR